MTTNLSSVDESGEVTIPDGTTHACRNKDFWKWVKLDEYLKWSKKKQEFVDGFRPTAPLRCVNDVSRIVVSQVAITLLHEAIDHVSDLAENAISIVESEDFGKKDKDRLLLTLREVADSLNVEKGIELINNQEK